jgi:hypothetical protein
MRRLSRAGMGEVLRPREGERPISEAPTAPESPAITPERQPLVAPDTHHAQPCWTGFAERRRPPCPRGDATAVTPARWGPKESRRPNRLLGYGNGPSVADRGAFSPSTQGGSLLASNGRITEQRPTGLGRQRSVPDGGRTKLLIVGQIPTDQRLRLTPSNSGRDYQDLVKRGRSDLVSTNLSLGHHMPQRLRTGQNRAPAPVRTGRAPAPCAPPPLADRRRRRPRTAPAVEHVRHPARHPRCAARCR